LNKPQKRNINEKINKINKNKMYDHLFIAFVIFYLSLNIYTHTPIEDTHTHSINNNSNGPDCTHKIFGFRAKVKNLCEPRINNPNPKRT